MIFNGMLYIASIVKAIKGVHKAYVDICIQSPLGDLKPLELPSLTMSPMQN